MLRQFIIKPYREDILYLSERWHVAIYEKEKRHNFSDLFPKTTKNKRRRKKKVWQWEYSDSRWKLVFCWLKTATTTTTITGKKYCDWIIKPENILPPRTHCFGDWFCTKATFFDKNTQKMFILFVKYKEQRKCYQTLRLHCCNANPSFITQAKRKHKLRKKSLQPEMIKCQILLLCVNCEYVWTITRRIFFHNILLSHFRINILQKRTIFVNNYERYQFGVCTQEIQRHGASGNFLFKDMKWTWKENVVKHSEQHFLPPR